MMLPLSSSLCAASVRLKNDTFVQLRVIVEGFDGSILGEVIVDPQQSMTWTDDYGFRANNRSARQPLQSTEMSKTPYTVSWYCMSGDPYSVCTDVAAGSLVMADACSGTRGCNPNAKEGYPTQPEEEIPSGS
jgi:hypothetical protein